MNRVYAGIDLHSNNNVVVVTDDESDAHWLATLLRLGIRLGRRW